MSSIKVIAFDLDDTLLDTSNILIPKAFDEAATAMIQAGLPASKEEVLNLRAQYRKVSKPSVDFFEYIAEHFLSDPKLKGAVLLAANEAFYCRDITIKLEPFEGAYELLGQLSEKYRLHLVTAGDPETQNQKVKSLKFDSIFNELHFVSSLKGERKIKAFGEILSTEKLSPLSLLSVGNRMDSEIEDAKRLGARTCLVQYGEYTHLIPTNPYQKPDYEISHIRDLIATCQL